MDRWVDEEGGKEEERKERRNSGKKDGRKGGEGRGTRLNPFLRNQKLSYLMDRLQKDILCLEAGYEKEKTIALSKFAIIERPTSCSINGSHKQHYTHIKNLCWLNALLS